MPSFWSRRDPHVLIRHARVADGVIHVVIGEREHARIPLDDILLVGEYTNAAGPYCDDYYLCLFTDDDGEYYQLSSDIAGVDDVARALILWSRGDLQFELYCCTDLRSRVSWPPMLAGERLFEFCYTPPTRWYHYLLKWFRIWPLSYRQELTPRAAEYLAFAASRQRLASTESS